jgi:ComF family protein
MGISRWRHGPEPSSLETMPDGVNLESSCMVDGGPCRDGWPRRAWLPWRSRCLGCGEPAIPGRDLCRACDQALPRLASACPTCGLPVPGGVDTPCDACRQSPPPLTRVVAPFLYAPPLDRWLPRVKFHRVMASGRLLSQLMLDACTCAPRPGAIVPVPLHRSRLRSRGYNQALELARPIALALAVPLRTDLLARTRSTSAQSSLPAAARRHNLGGAFDTPRTCAAGRVPAHVTLVDDVMTTGATLHAAAHALLHAGVARVDAWVCARTP